MENVIEGMEFEPRGISTDSPASVSELEFVAGPSPAESGEAYEKSLAETGMPNEGEAYPPVEAALEHAKSHPAGNYAFSSGQIIPIDPPGRMLTVDEVRAMEDIPAPPIAEALISVTAAVESFTESVAAATEAMQALAEVLPVELTAADLKKAYDDAVALWKPGHLRAKQTGYILYNSLDLPIELSAHVLQYLFDRAAELAPPEAK